MLSTPDQSRRLPEFLRKDLKRFSDKAFVFQTLRKGRLNTVCEEARCPNIGECFSNKTATFMILGDRCTRRCHFCSVKTGRGQKPDPNEAEALVEAVQSMGLSHVVITSVDRDDLVDDYGSTHFAHCIRALKDSVPGVTVELLTPDFKGDRTAIDRVLDAKPDIWGHNIETVQRLYRSVRPQSRFEVTCGVLSYVAQTKRCLVKSGMMVGLGETDHEVIETLHLLKSLNVELVTIGQYLPPTKTSVPVARYVTHDAYVWWKREGEALGFKKVFAGPFVRSSYLAKDVADFSQMTT